MKTNYKYFGLLIIAGLLMFFAGCDDDTLDEPRLFKPTNLSLSTEYNGFTASWKKTAGADGYKIEISVSSDFETIDAFIETDNNTLKAKFSDLLENQHYYVRLCGTRTDETLNSKYILGEITTNAAYSIFYPVNQDSISFSSVFLTWRDRVIADRIHVLKTSAGDTEAFDVPVNSDVLKNKQIKISGLTAGADYKVQLYNGKENFGYTVFSLPAIPENMITITPEEKGNLQNILNNAPEGATILFSGTGIFDYSTTDIIISKSVNLIGEPGTPKPLLYVKSFLIGGISQASSINVDNVSFTRLELSGYRLSGGVEFVEIEPNATTVSCDFRQTHEVNIGKIAVEDCIIRNYANSFIELNDKLKDAGTKARIGEINVNKALVYDMGRNKTNYPSFISITNKDDKNGHCRRYIIRNSTFHHLLRGIIEARVFGTIDGYINPEITIESCTFDKMGMKHVPTGEWWGANTEAAKNVFDCKVSDVTADIRVNITNCVWGELAVDKLSTSFVQGVTNNVVSSYMLTSTKNVINSGTTFFEGISVSVDELFPNRATNDYTIGVSGAVKNAGDPRWREN